MFISQANIESNFTSGGEEILESILTSIPKSTPSAEIIPWLREDLIPFVIHRFPVGKVSKSLSCIDPLLRPTLLRFNNGNVHVCTRHVELSANDRSSFRV